MYSSVVIEASSVASQAPSKSPNILLIIIITVVVVLIISSIFFSGSQPQDAPAPVGWIPNEASDLATVISTLDNMRAHAYIRKAYIGSSTLVNIPDFIEVNSKMETRQGKFLSFLLLYEAMNSLIGNANPGLFSRWKNLVLKGALNTSESSIEPMIQKVMAFYMSALKIYLIKNFNYISTNAKNMRIDKLLSSDITVNEIFFKDSIWISFISSQDLTLELVSYYLAFFNQPDPKINAPLSLKKADLLSSATMNGIYYVPILVSNRAQEMIDYLNLVIQENTFTLLIQ